MTESNEKSKPKGDSAIRSFISGGVGGLCAVLVGHPFDLVKVRIQTASSTAGSATPSVFGMIRKTLATEGIRGAYRGVSAPIFATSPMFAVSFWGYDMGKRVVQSVDSTAANTEEEYQFSLMQLCVAGGISALPTTAIMAPSERLKCLLQLDNNTAGGTKKYKGLVDCFQKVYAEGGMRSVYKGTGATLLRDVPGTIAWFGTYELVKKELMRIQDIDPSTGQLSPLAVLSAGGLAGISCWSISIPADVLKNRFQSAPPGMYDSLIDVYRHLMKEEGPMALFKGMRPALIRAFPANAACFYGMEMSQKAFGAFD